MLLRIDKFLRSFLKSGALMFIMSARAQIFSYRFNYIYVNSGCGADEAQEVLPEGNGS